MKAIRYTLAAALTVFAAASCQDNIAPEQNSESGIIINATIENTQTKTVLGEGVLGSDGKVHHKVLWTYKDNISVFDGAGNNHRFITYSETNSEAALFQLVSGDGGYCSESFDESGTYYYSIYPGNKNNYTFDATTKTISTEIDFIQTPKLNEPLHDLAFICGIGTNKYTNGKEGDAERTHVDMTFKNAVALIKFTLTSNDITQVRFIDQNNNFLCGNVTFKYSDGQSIISSATDKYVHINQTTRETVETTVDGETTTTTTYTYTPLEAGTYYMAIIPPSTMIKPRIDLYTQTTYESRRIDKTGDKAIKGKNEILLTPGTILDLGKFNASGRVTE